MIIWWRALQSLSASEAVQGVSNKKCFVCSQPRPTLPPALPVRKPCWAFGPRVPQQSTGLPSGYWTDTPCRSPTQNSKGHQTSVPPDSQTKQAERLHTAGSTHMRMSSNVKFWLLSRFWPLSRFWLLSYELKRIEIMVLLVLKITSVIFNI